MRSTNVLPQILVRIHCFSDTPYYSSSFSQGIIFASKNLLAKINVREDNWPLRGVP